MHLNCDDDDDGDFTIFYHYLSSFCQSTTGWFCFDLFPQSLSKVNTNSVNIISTWFQEGGK